MQFLSFIERAKTHLESHGIECHVTKGQPVDPQDIERFERLVGVAFPKELRSYLDELGDGFLFRANGCAWYLEPLAACIEEWGSNQDDLQEGEIQQYLASDGEEYLAECRRRRHWLPVAGFGGGGYTINYSCSDDLGAIRYHDIRRPGDTESARLGNSLEDWMAQWSRYSFGSPISGGDLCDFCYGVRGFFPWDDSIFNSDLKVNVEANR